MTSPEIKQQARELAEKCAKAIELWGDIEQVMPGTLTDLILRELNLEQLIADKQRLDWLRYPNGY